MKLVNSLLLSGIAIVAGCAGTAGIDINTAIPTTEQNTIIDTNMKITSSTFAENEEIPAKYSCDGEDVNPPLEFEDVPNNAKSLALIVDDPDAPVKTWLHWTLWNIPPDTTAIGENSIPDGAIQGMTDFGRLGYGGPCPPNGTHHYYFKIYALDEVLDLSSGASLNDLESAMNGHVIGQAQLIGQYSRN